MKVKSYIKSFFIPAVLDVEIKSSNSVEDFAGVSLTDDGFSVHGKSLLNEGVLDNVISNHYPLEAYKQARYSEIDSRTVDIISGGFTFADKQFSLSIPAQSNLTNIMTNRELFNSLGMFPISMSTMDNDLYPLQYVDVIAFWSAGMAVVKSAYNGGGVLKQQILLAATKEDVDVVVDNR